MLKDVIRRVLESTGYSVVKFPINDPTFRLVQLIRHLRVRSVLDVGANSGDFALSLRKFGYMGGIDSFEPVLEAYTRLAEVAANDNKWRVHRLALGQECGSQEINIAGNSGRSSSFLPMLERHSAAAPAANYIAAETVEVETVDRMVAQLEVEPSETYLKLDVQGFEGAVLDGSVEFLARAAAVQMELSLVSLYDGSSLFDSLYSRMQDLDYRLVHVAPGFTDLTTGETLQFDGVFVRGV